MKKINTQIYGIHPILEALKSGKTLDKLFIQQDLKTEQVNEIKSLARDLGVSVVKAPKEKLNRLCRSNHQGAVAFTSPIEFDDLEEVIQRAYERSETPLVLMLDKVSDVRNFGSIARSALSAGCHAIVIPHKGSAAITEEGIKASAGAIYHMPICKVLSLGDTIKTLKNAGIATVACTEKAEGNIYSQDLNRPVNLLFGNEGEGIDPHLLRMAGESALIPMMGEVASLNVAVATGICLFEAVRQRLG